MNKIGQKISSFLEKPLRVMVMCLIILTFSVVFNGSLWRLYHTNQNQVVLGFKIKEETIKISKITEQLHQLKNPAYIEKQARDRLEFLEKNDLLFVFSEN